MYLSSLNVRRRSQEKTNWCWAASTQMVSNYMGYSYSRTQIVKDIYGRDMNLGAFAWQIKNALAYATNHARRVAQRNGKQSTFSIPASVAESKIKSQFGSSGTGYYSNTIYLE